MAFSKNPTTDTYSTEDIDLTREITTRGGNITGKDEDYVNIFIEHTKSKQASDNRTFITKRAGSSVFFNGAIGAPRGDLFWADQKKFLYAIGTTIYIRDLVANTTASQVVFVSTVGDVGFSEYLYEDGTSVVLFSDGVKLGQISTTNVVTMCVDADLPPFFDPNIVVLDGYVFVAKLTTGDIYNSDLNAPLSWTPGGFINAEIEADSLVRLAKVNNYLVAFGKKTIEYFWDAGIATGSPLQRNDTPVKLISYLSGFAGEQNASYFIGKDYNGDIQVFKMYDFKVEPISTPSISRYLNSIRDDYTQWKGNVVAFMGHKFYVITAGSLTYYCDLDEDKLWMRLAYKATTTFPIYRATVITVSTAFTCIFHLNDGTGNWYQFDESVYQDDSVNYSCVLVTDAADFGTMNRKSMHRLSIQGDRPPAQADVLIQWSDDDYQTYNTGVSVNLNQDLPCTRQLGNFRQRAFKLTFSANTLFRIQGMVADINKGNS
jgi:hypothetical protein